MNFGRSSPLPPAKIQRMKSRVTARKVIPNYRTKTLLTFYTKILLSHLLPIMHLNYQHRLKRTTLNLRRAKQIQMPS